MVKDMKEFVQKNDWDANMRTAYWLNPSNPDTVKVVVMANQQRLF